MSLSTVLQNKLGLQQQKKPQGIRKGKEKTTLRKDNTSKLDIESDVGNTIEFSFSLESLHAWPLTQKKNMQNQMGNSAERWEL